MALNLDDPIEVALASAGAFERAGLEVALYGGLALATYGEPRETRDADLAVASVTADAGQSALEAAGISAAITFASMRFGGLTIGRITLVGGGKLNVIDLVTPRSPRYAQLVMTRAMRGMLDGQELRVVSPEDFILLKVLSKTRQGPRRCENCGRCARWPARRAIASNRVRVARPGDSRSRCPGKIRERAVSSRALTEPVSVA